MNPSQIKFRGKNKVTNKWVYGWFRYCGKIPAIISHKKGIPFEIIPDTIQMYTGYNDKNDRPIYEGDLLQIDGNERYQRAVIYDDNRAGFRLVDSKHQVEPRSFGQFIREDNPSLIIVGNIIDYFDWFED